MGFSISEGSAAKVMGLPCYKKQAPRQFLLVPDWMVIGSTVRGCCEPWRWKIWASVTWCWCCHPSWKLSFFFSYSLCRPVWCERCGMYGCIKLNMLKNDCSCYSSEGEVSGQVSCLRCWNKCHKRQSAVLFLTFSAVKDLLATFIKLVKLRLYSFSDLQ